MATTDDLLTHMEDLDSVLAQKSVATTAGALRNRAIRALNRGQDVMELLIARRKDLFSEPKDVTLTASQEYSATDAALRRIDSVWFISSGTSRPQYEIDAIRQSGAHRSGRPDPLLDTGATATTGKPTGYWWERRNSRLYWDRDPDAAHTVRVIGFYAVSTDLSIGSTFGYPDEFIVPLAALAVRVFKFRTDVAMAELEQFGQLHFTPILDQYVHAWKHQQGEAQGDFPNW